MNKNNNVLEFTKRDYYVTENCSFRTVWVAFDIDTGIGWGGIEISFDVFKEFINKRKVYNETQEKYIWIEEKINTKAFDAPITRMISFGLALTFGINIIDFGIFQGFESGLDFEGYGIDYLIWNLASCGNGTLVRTNFAEINLGISVSSFLTTPKGNPYLFPWANPYDSGGDYY